jgi:flagellar biosynthesis/type III secretory pathway ATPase
MLHECNKPGCCFLVASKVMALLFEDFLTRNNRAMEKKRKIGVPPTTVRLPPALHAEVKELAARAGHSMNKEIIQLLETRIQSLKLSDISQQNSELKQMVQRVLDRLD